MYPKYSAHGLCIVIPKLSHGTAKKDARQLRPMLLKAIPLQCCTVHTISEDVLAKVLLPVLVDLEAVMEVTIGQGDKDLHGHHWQVVLGQKAVRSGHSHCPPFCA